MNNTEQMMNDLLEKFPYGSEWKIEYKKMLDQSNTLVPYCCIKLGTYINNDMLPFYVDKKGNISIDKQHKDDYECCIFYYESSVEDCVKEIYEEVMKRIDKNYVKQKITNEFCGKCGTQQPCPPNGCDALKKHLKKNLKK